MLVIVGSLRGLQFMSEGRIAIETIGLTRRFEPGIVVDRLDLNVAKGDVYGFLGPNGAGKTTTIRMLLGLIRPDAGIVRIFGTPFRAQLLASIGSLVETPSLYSHLSGRENLEVTRRLLDAPRASLDRVLQVVRLSGDASRLVREYSLGMRQRLGLALALLHTPQLLILDEPTNGLDPAGIHEMRDLLRRMPSEHGVTVFLSSHLLSEVEQIAGFVGIIHKGRMIFQGPLTELRKRRDHRLTIGVRQTDAALKFLHASGIEAYSCGPSFVSVGCQSQDAEKINRALVENGHEIFHVSVEQDSLEEIFLSMTGGRTQ